MKTAGQPGQSWSLWLAMASALDIDMTQYTPREIAAELGYHNESRPGIVVRRYLRRTHPDHPRNARWILDEAQAADVRLNLPRHT